MHYIVLDLEFNQAFPFKTGATTTNPECPFEIIQIGAVKLDETFAIIDELNLLIRPQIYPRIHPFVEKITGITLNQLRNQPDFPTAYTSFLAFIGEGDAILGTWGIDDIKSLFKNILFYDLDPNLLTDRYVNVQAMAAHHLAHEAGKCIGLKNAVTELGLAADIPFHNALHDALYTARIFQIVHTNPVRPETFQLMDLAGRKLRPSRVHMRGLLSHFEDKLERELSPNEIGLIKAAYKLGSKHAFDIPQKKPT